MHITQPNKPYRRVVVNMLVPADISLAEVTDGINELLNESALRYGPDRSAFHDYTIDTRDEKVVNSGPEPAEGTVLFELMTTNLNRPRATEDMRQSPEYIPAEIEPGETYVPLPQPVARKLLKMREVAACLPMNRAFSEILHILYTIAEPSFSKTGNIYHDMEKDAGIEEPEPVFSA